MAEMCSRRTLVLVSFIRSVEIARYCCSTYFATSPVHGIYDLASPETRPVRHDLFKNVIRFNNDAVTFRKVGSSVDTEQTFNAPRWIPNEPASDPVGNSLLPFCPSSFRCIDHGKGKLNVWIYLDFILMGEVQGAQLEESRFR